MELRVVAMTDDDGNGIGKFGSQAQSFRTVYSFSFLFWFVHLIIQYPVMLPTRRHGTRR